MAYDWVLDISDEASGTVVFTTSPRQISQWQRGVPSGLETARNGEVTVTDTIEIRLMDGSGTANLDEVRTLNRLLQSAEDYRQGRSNTPIYLRFKESASGEVFRSPIVRGAAYWNDDATEYPYWNNSTQFSSVFVERKNYWEGAPVAVSLSNVGGTATTGLTVYNGAKVTGANPCYAQIEGTAIAGDLPSPAVISVQNGHNDSAGIDSLWVGHNVHSDPANFNPLLEGEAGFISGGTAVAGAGYSGGTAWNIDITNTGEVNVATWTLGSSFLDDCAGQYFMLLMNIPTGGTAAWFRPYLYYGAVVPLWKGPLVRFETNNIFTTRELAVMQLPPWVVGINTPDDLSLRLYAKWISGTTTPLVIDYLMVLPVNGYRKYLPNGELAYQHWIIDDPISGKVYRENNASAARRGDMTVTGNPIMLEPGKLQRLYFVAEWDGTDVNNPMVVKVTYRPRRITL